MTPTIGSRLIPSLAGHLQSLGHATRGGLAALRPRGRGALWLALTAAAGALVLQAWPGAFQQTSWRTGRLGRDAPRHFSTLGDVITPGGARHAPPEATPAVPWARRILRQATLEIELPDLEHAVARLAEIIEAAGGYVADTHTHADGAGVLRATVTAYVSPAAFGRTLRDLEPLGRVITRRISGQDVSEEFVDLEARVRNFERHEAQLLGFMGKAQKVADLLALENELARVRGEIERLTGRIRFLRARSEMAAIQLSLVRAGAAAPPGGLLSRAWERLRQAFVAGWQAAFDVAVGIAALAAQLSPLAIPALLARGLYRRFRRQPASPPPAVPA